MSFTPELMQGLSVISEVASLLREIKDSGKSIEEYLEDTNWQPIYSPASFNRLTDDEKRAQRVLAHLYTTARVKDIISNPDDVNLQEQHMQLCPDGSLYAPYISEEDFTELDSIEDLDLTDAQKESPEYKEIVEQERKHAENLAAAEKQGLESPDEVDSRVLNAISKDYSTESRIRKYIRRDERIVQESLDRLLENGTIGKKQVKRSIVYFIIDDENQIGELDNIEI